MKNLLLFIKRLLPFAIYFFGFGFININSQSESKDPITITNIYNGNNYEYTITDNSDLKNKATVISKNGRNESETYNYKLGDTIEIVNLANLSIEVSRSNNWKNCVEIPDPKYIKTLGFGLNNKHLVREKKYVTVNGILTDSSGKPFAGVEVYTEGAKSITGIDGRYELYGLKKRTKYELAFKLPKEASVLITTIIVSTTNSTNTTVDVGFTRDGTGLDDK